MQYLHRSRRRNSMSAHVETMAYAGETPWHGLGVPVSNDMSVEQMLTASGCDWTVSKKPMYFLTNPDYVDLGEKPNMKLVPDEYAIIRDDNKSVLDTCGSKWKPIQNRESFDFLTRFVKAGDMSMETMGSLKGGRYVW